MNAMNDNQKQAYKTNWKNSVRFNTNGSESVSDLKKIIKLEKGYELNKFETFVNRKSPEFKEAVRNKMAFFDMA